MNDIKGINKNQEDTIILYKEIEDQLKIHKVTMWKVLRYGINNALIFTNINNAYKPWKRFSLTNKGISYSHMKDYAYLVNTFCNDTSSCNETSKAQSKIQLHEIKTLVRIHNIAIRDLYNYWLEYNNTHNKKIAKCSYKTFEHSYHRNINHKSYNNFGAERIQEIFIVIELMLKENYHYTKKTKKSDKYVWNNLTTGIK